mmetsp:Transcript_12171/g.28631  ORF Transcript_12171/g.28631 Transcript_12171/m.28631 type:complete len:312 (+) Transcript_12171:46-981(+)
MPHSRREHTHSTGIEESLPCRMKCQSQPLASRCRCTRARMCSVRHSPWPTKGTPRQPPWPRATLEHGAVVVPRAVALAARVVELLAVLGHREVRHDVGVAHVDQLGVARVVLLGVERRDVLNVVGERRRLRCARLGRLARRVGGLVALDSDLALLVRALARGLGHLLDRRAAQQVVRAHPINHAQHLGAHFLQLARHECLHLHAEVVAVGHLGRLDLQPHLHGLEVLDRLRRLLANERVDLDHLRVDRARRPARGRLLEGGLHVCQRLGREVGRHEPLHLRSPPRKLGDRLLTGLQQLLFHECRVADFRVG